METLAMLPINGQETVCLRRMYWTHCASGQLRNNVAVIADTLQAEELITGTWTPVASLTSHLRRTRPAAEDQLLSNLGWDRETVAPSPS